MAFKKREYRQIVDGIIGDFEGRSSLTDTNVGSVSRTIVESIGREIAILYEEMDAAYNAGFIDSARGSSLDMVVAVLGVRRKSAQYATGSVTFSRKKANNDVTIPRGTRVSTVSSDPRDTREYETSMTVSLSRGKNGIEVPIKAVAPGKDGMADFETITKLASPIVGIDGLINKHPTTMGTERESDDELRARAKAVVLSSGKTTVESIISVLLTLPGVRSVSINDMPEGIPGEIDVIIDGPDLRDREGPLFEMMEETIERVRPAGIKVNIISTSMVRTDITVFLSLTDVVRTDEETDETLASIRGSISDHFSSMGSGDNIVKNKLITAVYNAGYVEKIEGVDIRTRVFDERIGGLVEDTRKRREERTGNIELNKYERAELARVELRTRFSPGLVSYVLVDISASVIPVKRTMAVERMIEGIEARMEAHFERLRGGEEIDFQRIENLIKGVEGISELRELRLSALYEDSGMTVKEAMANIPIGTDEIVKLRDVRVEMIG